MFSKFIMLIIYISIFGVIILSMVYYRYKNPVGKIKKQYMPKGLRKPITKKQFEKQLLKTLFLISICCLINFIFYFDIISLPKKTSDTTWFAGKEVFESNYKIISWKINIGDGVITYFENFIMLMATFLTFIFNIDLAILLIRRYESKNK